MTWKAAGVVALGFAASTACGGEPPRPAATASPAAAAPGIVATAAAPPVTSAAAPPAAGAPAATAPAAAPAGAPAAPAGGGAALAREETKWPGVVAEVTEFRRKGNTLTARVRFRNQGTAAADPDFVYPETYVMDAAAGKKYAVLKDENGAYIGAVHQGWKDRWYERIPPGGETTVWMKFPAPPADVKAVTFQIPGVPPFDDLAIQDS